MQISNAKRQDEPAIRALVLGVMQEHELKPDLKNVDSDLLDLNYYFDNQGVFLIAEDDGKIVGLAAGRPESSGVFELIRLCVAKKARGKKIARQLLAKIVDHAAEKGYKKIVVEPIRQQYATGADVLTRCGFTFTSDPVEDAQQVWYYELKQPVRA